MRNFLKPLSYFIILSGLCVILGWIFDIAFLKSISPGFVTMKQNTALGLTIAGLCLNLLITRKSTALYYIFSSVLLLLSLAFLFEDISGINLGIDEMIVKDNEGGVRHPGRPAVSTSFCFMLLSFAFLTLYPVKSRLKAVGQFCLHFTTLISFIAIAGYIMGVPTFYKLFFFSYMAIHSAVLLFLLSLGASTIYPDLGINSFFKGGKTGSIILRRLFPQIVIILILLGVLEIFIYRKNVISQEFGIALFTTSFIIIALFLLVYNANRLNHLDDERTLVEQRMRFLVEHTPAGVAMFDRQMRYLLVSNRWKEDYGVANKNIIGVNHYELFPEISEQWKEFHRRGLAGEKIGSAGEQFPRADGSVDWVKWNLFPWYTAKEEIGGIIIFAELITEQKLAEEKLRASEENYRSIYENTIVAMITTNMKTLKPIMVNDIGAELLGYKSKQDFLDNYDPLLHFTVPQRETNIEMVKKLGEVSSDVQEIKKLDGSSFWGKLFVKLNSTKEIAHTVIIDVSEQVKARQNLSDKVKELESSNKELETFNYISSHDLQEPLRKLKNFSSVLLETEKNLSEDGRHYLKRMFETSQRMQGLIEDIVAYSRVKNSAKIFEKYDLNTLVEEAISKMAGQIREQQAVIKKEVSGSAEIIKFQFLELMHNLISNSLKFSYSNRIPIIEIKSNTGSGYELNSKLIPEKKYCHIIYIDNGIGFEAKYNEKVFEIFERLHPADKYPGTGIGLAVCRRIVENHNGLILAHGEPDKGARFDIYLPETRG